VTEIGTSPALAVARQAQRRVRQLEMILRLYNTAARTVPEPAQLERREALPRDEFFARYYAAERPVVLPKFASHWKAVTRWSPQHFKQRFGAVEVQMTSGREGDPDYDMNREKYFAPTTMGAFVDRVVAQPKSNDFYLIARNHNTARNELQPLWDDIDWSFGWLERAHAPKGSALWFGPAGTITPLHHDTSSILFVQVYGEKKLVLASPTEIALLDGARAMYADLDPERPDFKKHPSHKDVLLHDVVLGPGDALFIPAGWWHYVRALSVSISLAFNNFVRPNPFSWYVPGAIPM